MQWPITATGDVAPRYALCGSHTGLGSPASVAVDAGGNVYAGNPTLANVTVYAAGPHGNQRPIATIGGANTQIGSAFGLGVDAAGNIYVVNGQYPGTVLVFPPGSNGNVAPIQNISVPGLFSTNIAVSDNGQMYVTGEYSNGSYHSDSVLVYAPGSTGSATPIQTINGPDTGLYNPSGIALDSHGNMYVSNYVAFPGPSLSPSITVYAAGATGDAKPIRTITGSNTGLDYNYGIALDASGNIYVMNAEGGPAQNGSVTVYRNKANGNVSPIRTITGSNVAAGSWGIAVH
jgi:sugar lactone lactonase YvrE